MRDGAVCGKRCVDAEHRRESGVVLARDAGVGGNHQAADRAMRDDALIDQDRADGFAHLDADGTVAEGFDRFEADGLHRAVILVEPARAQAVGDDFAFGDEILHGAEIDEADAAGAVGHHRRMRDPVFNGAQVSSTISFTP